MTSVRVEQNEDMTYFVRITLFEKAEARIDENGQRMIEIQCTRSAAEYIFNIESISYLRYDLKSVVSLTSRYSYIMFMYLRNGEWKHHSLSRKTHLLPHLHRNRLPVVLRTQLSAAVLLITTQ